MLDDVRMDMYTVSRADGEGDAVDLLLRAPLRANRYLNVKIPVSAGGWRSNAVLTGVQACHDGLVTEETCFEDQPVMVNVNDDGSASSISGVMDPGLKTLTSDGSITGDSDPDDSIFRMDGSHVTLDDGVASIVITFTGGTGKVTMERPVDEAPVLYSAIVDAASDVMRRLSMTVNATGRPIVLGCLVGKRPFHLYFRSDRTPEAVRSVYNDEEFMLDGDAATIGRPWEVEPIGADGRSNGGVVRTVDSIDVGLCRFTARAFIKISFSDHVDGLPNHVWAPLYQATVDALTGGGHVTGDLDEAVSGREISVSWDEAGSAIINGEVLDPSM